MKHKKDKICNILICYLKKKIKNLPIIACSKGSITVEAALVIPIFIFALMAFIYYYLAVDFQSNMDIMMYETVKELSVEQGVDSDYYIAKTSQDILEKISNTNQELFFLDNGVNGIDFSKSRYNSESESIEINVEYFYKVPIDIFNLMRIRFSNKICMRRFSGCGDRQDEWIYVTPYGKTYHIYKDCPYINVKLQKIKLSNAVYARNASGGKYYPCNVCNINNNNVEYVYISLYGNSYHTTDMCSSIYRNVTAVKPEQAGNRTLCRKCALR